MPSATTLVAPDLDLDLEGEDPEVIRLVREAMESDSDFQAIYEADFERRPPTIEEFLCSDEFLGSVCTPEDAEEGGGLYTAWREVLYRDFAGGAEHCPRKFIMTGAIGQGKSWVASIILLYKLAWTLCLRNPFKFYGISEASSIVFSFFSITQKQVFGGAFGDCVKFLKKSPFFRSKMVDNAETRKYADRRVLFHGDILIEAGSRVSEAIGRNVICSFVDEVNFRLEKNAGDAAHKLVEAIHRRILSRFRKEDDNPGMLILVSSSQYESDYLNTYVKKNRNNPDTRVYDMPWWEVAGREKITYSGEKFLVDIGDSIIEPSILEPADVANVPPARVIEVPVEHLEEFQSDLSGAIRDLAGMCTGKTGKLFPGELVLINCIRDGLENPLPGIVGIPLSVDYKSQRIEDHLNVDAMLKVRGGSLTARRHPQAPRFIHMDMSTGAEDAMGIVCVHPCGMQEVEGVDRRTHNRVRSLKPVVEVDFVLRITRDRKSPKAPIDFGRIREFIWWLQDVNFDVSKVTCDLRMLSHEMITILNENGVDATYRSVDIKKIPYYMLRQVILEDRLATFDHELLFTELKFLEDGDKKIDHPDTFGTVTLFGQDHQDMKGSKDLADGLCGAVYECLSSKATHDWLKSFAENGEFEEAKRMQYGSKEPEESTIPTF